ncbi:MFS transporter [Lactococcus lactis]|uniref:MFS transporter n=1 Tax=Lactococcus lactis TaxID=1358 RepID=UPI0011113814|nr:MFS transporter [Lactococcus lactis]
MEVRENLTGREKVTIVGFFVAIFIVGLDSFIISSLLTTIATTFKATVGEVGIGVSLYALFYAIGAPVIAPFSERLPKKRMMMIGLILFTLSTLLCGLSTNLSIFYLARSLAGLGAAMLTPSIYAYVGGNFSAKQVGKVMGIVMSALSLSIAIGIPVGSFIASVASWRWSFYASAIVGVLAFVVILFAVLKDIPKITKYQSPFSHYRNILGNKKAVLGLITLLIWMYGFYAFYTYLGTYITRQFSLALPSVGLVFMVYGIANFLSSFFGGWVGNFLGMRRTVVISGIVCSLAYIFGGLTTGSLVLFVVLLVIIAFTQGFANPQLITYNATILPESRGTMTSLSSSFLYLGLTVGSALGGVIFSNSSFTGLTVSSAIATIIALLIGAFLYRSKE